MISVVKWVIHITNINNRLILKKLHYLNGIWLNILTLNQKLNLSLNELYNKTSYNNTFILAMEAYESLNFEKSIELFSEYLQTYPNNQFAWCRLGNSYNQIGRYTYDKETLNNSISCLLK